jgi:hypothetical protein
VSRDIVPGDALELSQDFAPGERSSTPGSRVTTANFLHLLDVLLHGMVVAALVLVGEEVALAYVHPDEAVAPCRTSASRASTLATRSAGARSAPSALVVDPAGRLRGSPRGTTRRGPSSFPNEACHSPAASVTAGARSCGRCCRRCGTALPAAGGRGEGGSDADSSDTGGRRGCPRRGGVLVEAGVQAPHPRSFGERDEGANCRS